MPPKLNINVDRDGFFTLSYIAGYFSEAVHKQSQPTFLLRLTWLETAYKKSFAISR